ncbi:MBL fold metallo-hydrolase [Nocardia sp. BMG111209]|uniref:MBL fold metallo-hydrolase n=1 Tax=Nocardia sp. BMG111209 TaxID=1160137 RepID=UPI0003AA6740|nr:MBL fold metallo-hydrolase [Nocardia sp. BMG111209]
MSISVSADDRLTRPGGIHTVEVGELVVQYLPDGLTPLHGAKWLPGTTPEFWADGDHAKYLNADGDLIASVGGLLVTHRGLQRSMLIDAGFGPMDYQTPFGMLQGGAMLGSLRAVGLAPTDVELVALTHLHGDHIGYLWQAPDADGRFPFAHARVAVAGTEWARPDLAAREGTSPEMVACFADQVEVCRDGEEIFPGVTALTLPGHTIGHTGYLLRSEGVTLIVLGDALHTPLQVTYPDLSSASDLDPQLAIDVRRRIVNTVADNDFLAFGGHFAAVQFGHCRRADGGVAVWQPLPAE